MPVLPGSLSIETRTTVRVAIKVFKKHRVRETQIVFINLFVSYDSKNYLISACLYRVFQYYTSNYQYI